MPLRIPDGAKYIRELAKTGWPNLAEVWNKESPYPDINLEEVTSLDVRLIEDLLKSGPRKRIFVKLEVTHQPEHRDTYPITYFCSYDIIPTVLDVGNTPVKFFTEQFMMKYEMDGKDMGEVEKERSRGESYVGRSPYPREYMKSKEYKDGKFHEDRLKDIIRKKELAKALTMPIESRSAARRFTDRGETRTDYSALRVSSLPAPAVSHIIKMNEDRVNSGPVCRVTCSCAEYGRTYCDELIDWYGKRTSLSKVLVQSKRMTTLRSEPVFFLPFCRGYVSFKAKITHDVFEGDTLPDAMIAEDYNDPRLKVDISGERGETFTDLLSIVTRHYTNTEEYDHISQVYATLNKHSLHMPRPGIKNPFRCNHENHDVGKDKQLAKSLVDGKAFVFPWGVDQVLLGNAYTVKAFGFCVECCSDMFDPTFDVPF